MIFPRTIGIRIFLGFGLLILAITLNAIFSYRVIHRIQDNQKELSGTLEPSIRQLFEFQGLIHEIRDLVQEWEYSGEGDGSPILPGIRLILDSGFPETNRQILQLSEQWQQRDREAYGDFYGYLSDSLLPSLSLYLNNPLPPDIPDSLASGRTGPDHHFEILESDLTILVNRFDRLATEANERTADIYRKVRNILLVTGVIIAFAGIVIAVLLYLSLVNPIKQYRDTITSMGEGIIPDREFREGPDEMGEIGTALNRLIRGLRNLSGFAEEIGKGNFKSDFTPLGEQDILGNSLIQLREDLHNAAIEEEKRKREDERRNWSNQGIARFSELLREYSGDTASLARQLVSELVKYLGARVGGIFLIRRDPSGRESLDMIASYAYDRAKHLKKSIEPGEGLVGRCVQEGSTIFLTEIPDDYIKIKSGLGEDNPKSLMIVPIRLNDRIIGVMEIASLEVYQDFQIEFVERIGSSIASSLSGDHTGISKNRESGS
jgi:hypothetical protein